MSQVFEEAWDERTQTLVNRVLGSPSLVPVVFWEAVKSRLEVDPPRLLASSLVGTSYATVTPAELESITEPVDEQRVLLEVDSTNSIYWELVRRRTQNRWVVLGGAPLTATVSTQEAASSTGSYVDLATVGPQVTLPAAGSYIVAHGCGVEAPANATAFQSLVGVVLNGVSPPMAGSHIARFYVVGDAAGASFASIVTESPPLTFARNDTVRQRYRVNSVSLLFNDRWIKVWPRSLT